MSDVQKNILRKKIVFLFVEEGKYDVARHKIDKCAMLLSQGCNRPAI
jgi:hypothetical protein